MCVDYTDLNWAGPKDLYLLPSICELVNSLVGYKLLSFLDAYSGYNQIPMFGSNRGNIDFMTKKSNYQYNMMPFKLKNACTTYQKMMNRVFQEEASETLEVYMDSGNW